MEFLFGSYAEKGSPGILAGILDEERQTLCVHEANSELENPSWLMLHPNGSVLYAVEETAPEGQVVCLERTPGGWRAVQSVRTEAGPCHLSMDERQAYLFASNYPAGSLGVYRLLDDGRIAEQTDMVHHTGHGVDPVRQEGPHVHATLCVDDLIYTTDLGLDRVFVYRLNRRNGTLSEVSRIEMEDGAGPRHMAMVPGHPEILYVVGELSGYVYKIDLKQGRCTASWQIVPSDPGDTLRASAVKAVGQSLYIGCREWNAVTIFAIGPDGNLGERTVYRHSQKIPRDVWMNEQWCITTDEGSRGITLLRRTGNRLRQVMFTETGTVKPTCVVPVAP